MTSGMVLGKFMPPHLGHAYLVEFSRHYVDDLTIIVGTLPTEPIDGNLRFQWMQEMFEGPGVRVVHLDKVLPQDPSEHPNFWKLWHDALRPLVPEQLDYVFASESYGTPLANILDATFVPVDISRNIMPVSGTKVRNQPLTHWEYLPRCVRPYFTKRICIFGPESTGKSTLATNLADHYQTVAVPEYARTVIESQDGEITLKDIPVIAKGQAASEDALTRSANRVLFCDTDLLTTTLWSNWLFQTCPNEVLESAKQQHYDLSFLLDVDVPWVQDTVRYFPKGREQFFEQCEQALITHQRRYHVLRGSWEKRFEQAVSIIDDLIDESKSNDERTNNQQA